MLLRLQQKLTHLMRNDRLRILYVALIVLSIFGIIITYNTQPDLRFCFMDNISPLVSAGTQRLQDVLQADLKPVPGRSIFFHETSCHQLEPKTVVRSRYSDINALTSINLVQLTARQGCAIESAALHNPNLSVFVLFVSPVYRDNTTNRPIIDAIESYANVHLRNLNLWNYAAGTPLQEWLKDGKLFKSRYVLSHLSDFLRYLTLYRYGGTYLDMDIVMLKSIEDIPPNYSGAESNNFIAAGVMNFANDGFGHEMAEQCLHDFQMNFDGSDWGNNGPGVITRVAQTVCGTKDITLMLDRKRCMGFNVFKRDAFYAIPWKEWEHFFEPKYLKKTLERTKDSYVVHVWNKHSKQRSFKVGTQGAYGKFAEQHCPKVYAVTGEFF